MNTLIDYGNGPSLGMSLEWTITDRLKKARVSTGLDQEQFGDRIGVSRGTVSNYEKGVDSPKRPIILAWAMGSGVSYEWLMTGEEPPPRIED